MGAYFFRKPDKQNVNAVTPSAARDIADSALAFIAADPDRAEAFLFSSGATADQLRTLAQQPDFAGFILDFMLQSDAHLIEFQHDFGVSPAQVHTARHLLSGPQEFF